MADGLGMVSGSEDDEDDDPVVSGDEGEVPAALPLALLADSAVAAPATKPTTTAGSDIDDAAEESASGAQTVAMDASKGTDDAEDSDSEDDAKLTTPNQMPPHRPLTAPVAESDAAEPFDAAKAAEMARKGVGDGTQSKATASASASLTAVASERTPGVVDEALRGLVLMLKGEKNDSICQVPMCQCVHGLVKDDDGKTWPPYEITLAEARQSQFARQTWLSVHMQADPTRMFNTILFFNTDALQPVGVMDLDPNASYNLQAMLPGVLVNPDDNADAAKRIAEYNETIGSSEWTFAIPVPTQFVKSMYKQHKHGLPSLYNPLTNDNVKFQLFNKVETQCARYEHWKLVVDKSREGQAAAANGGGRSKRVAVGGGGEDAARKRVTKPSSTTIATAEKRGSSTEPATEASPPPPPPPPPPQQPRSPPQPHMANIQTTLHFQTTAQPVASSTESTDSAESAVLPEQPEQPTFPLALQPSVPPFAAAALSWTSITPEWYSIVVPKLPKGFVVEMSAPTAHCSGMVSFKRSSSNGVSEF